MNYHELKQNIRQYLVFYLLGFCMILGLKYYYSQANSDALIWILAPTTKWVSILSGIPFVYESGMGYVNHSLLAVIAPSCCGIRFMMIMIAMLIFSFIHRIEPSFQGSQEQHPLQSKKCWGWMIFTLPASYLLTVFINGLRIIVAMYLPLYLEQTAFYQRFLTADNLHTIIGTAVYFVALLVIYRLADSFLRKSCESSAASDFSCQAPRERHSLIPLMRRFLAPLFWYFFIVLGLPLLNSIIKGGNKKGHEQFTEYALLITFVCTLILLLCMISYCAGTICRKRSKRSSNCS